MPNTEKSDFDRMILVDKPAGMSSFGVVARIRRVLTKQYNEQRKQQNLPPVKHLKVGHTGTLDPFATGLLIIMTGKMTKHCQEFLKHDKEYVATLCLGKTSTTGDPEGEISDGHTCEITLHDVRRVLDSFTGTITQKVPAFSAVKINGRRAYDLARQGKTPDTPTRQVEIYSIELISYNYPELVIKTHVSSGTYIRTLAEDIGKSLGTGAYLTALRRTKIAEYDVKDAQTLADFGVKD